MASLSQVSGLVTLPRLRLSRNSLTQREDDDGRESARTTSSSSKAGPSRDISPRQLLDTLRSREIVLETPADRLRALMARVPHSTSNINTNAPTSRVQPVSPPEIDSDFEPPWVDKNPSFAQNSIKDLFSRALEGTPEKSKARPRRNSIDSSSVGMSLELEQAKPNYGGARKSISDDEWDGPLGQWTCAHWVRSRLMTISADSLRPLNSQDTIDVPSMNSHTHIMNQKPPFENRELSAVEQTITLTISQSWFPIHLRRSQALLFCGSLLKSKLVITPRVHRRKPCKSPPRHCSQVCSIPMLR